MTTENVDVRMINKQLDAYNMGIEDRQCGQILLGGAIFGQDEARLSKLFEIDPSFVSTVADRLRKADIWKDGKTYANWLEEDGGFDFLLDVCVGLGFLEKRSGSNRKFAKGKGARS